jgi:hypothetical protein
MDKSEVEETTWIEATVHAPDGEMIGVIDVLSNIFDNYPECSAEVVLLSSNAENVSNENCREKTGPPDNGCIQHLYGCDHVRSRNIMLIEWIGNVACRRGLGMLKKNGWAKVVAKEKRIVLG